VEWGEPKCGDKKAKCYNKKIDASMKFFTGYKQMFQKNFPFPTAFELEDENQNKVTFGKVGNGAISQGR
jgi:hypothetical protein